MEAFVPYYQQSPLKRGVDTIGMLATRAADTRPGHLLVALFEPLELPEHSDERGDDADQSQKD